MTYPSTRTYPSATVRPSGSSRDITITADVEPDRFTASLGVNVPRTIPTSQGAVEYVVVNVAEVTGASIEASVMQVSLGTYSTPGEWLTPDSVTNPTDSTAAVSLLVGASYLPTPGRYWAWVQVGDSPEQIPVRASTAVTIA